jgi:hypothetical protein
VLSIHFMTASPASPRSIALTGSSSALPRLVNHVVGDLLELMVYSIEGLRDRITASLRRDRAI